jgi:hypothetical protein
MTRYITAAEAETPARRRLADYEARFGPLTAPPVPLERMIDEIYDLRILWAPFDSPTFLQPLAGLQPSARRIVINERRRDWFDKYPGALNFTLAHELGHWDLHVDQGALEHPVFDGLDVDGARVRFRTPLGAVDVLLSKLHAGGLSQEESYAALRMLTTGIDGFFEARQVNRYAAALLMPSALLLRSIEGEDLLDRASLRRLATSFAVSVQALIIRLEGLGRLFVAPNGSLYVSRAAYTGQASLF